jgi:hypothetical protein
MSTEKHKNSKEHLRTEGDKLSKTSIVYFYPPDSKIYFADGKTYSSQASRQVGF